MTKNGLDGYLEVSMSDETFELPDKLRQALINTVKAFGTSMNDNDVISDDQTSVITELREEMKENEGILMSWQPQELNIKGLMV